MHTSAITVCTAPTEASSVHFPELPHNIGVTPGIPKVGIYFAPTDECQCTHTPLNHLRSLLLYDRRRPANE